ncbi:putative bifunctional diguanylate cyclase/phosphodiesterase [Brevibacillus dissolubilis]|uniref:putative bifunctional diguanylate cyclase/phosphodiesterase n=1 Tax=Brevibacillus dissolubilis TaxID=1844116 RepID=UPI00159BB5BE|nr:EAL domain-containing protein [Brevibacillus dissolubilis]
MGWFILDKSIVEEHREFEKAHFGSVPTYAYQLQLLGHNQLVAGPQTSDPAYRRIKYVISQWQIHNRKILHIYTMRKSPVSQDYVYVLSSMNRSGQLAGSPNDGIIKAFEGVASVASQPIQESEHLSVGSYAPIYDENGQVEAVIGVHFDGTDWFRHIDYDRYKVMGLLLLPLLSFAAVLVMVARFRMEKLQISHHRQSMQESEDRFRRLSESTSEGIIIHDKGIIVEANDALARMFGYEPHEVVGMSVLDFAAPESYEVLRANYARNHQGQYEVKGLCKDGTTLELELTGKSINYKGKEMRVSVVRDITSRKRSEEKVHFFAYYDELTRMPNRKLFLDQLEYYIQQLEPSEEQIAVMIIDLDRFKLMNDTMGHSFGDQILIEVAKRLCRCVGEKAFISRLGSDEFGLIYPHVKNSEEVREAASEVLASLTKSMLICGEHELEITTTIGVSLYPEHGTDVQTLIKNADLAMYRSKDLGRNNYLIYTPSMDEKVLERLEIEKDLRRAIERNELFLHYQPQVNLHTGEIIGMEALIRWKHPVRGVVSPGLFIPIAEDSRLIIPIGEWVIETACRQNMEWQKAGLQPIRIGVNLSAYQFQLEDIVERVSRILKQTAMNPKYLELEITESIAMYNVERVIKTLHELKLLGVQIAIDDFGTGYSSLSYLKLFPIDRLKIDRTFVNDITQNEDDAAIAASIIGMAHSLKLQVIAEGVETTDQLDFLANRNCDEMQGFFFSRPLGAEEAGRLLIERKCLERHLA